MYRSDVRRLASAVLRPFCLTACLAAILAGAGCRTVAMKGTPFFAGEYTKRTGPVEERVNAWPLLYYREPALSVLWPLVDWTDDYFAFRPVFSMYGWGGKAREYNVLWPLTHFEQWEHGNNWVLPFFWGHGYAVGFPLYWHFAHPLSDDGGVDALFPLWCFITDRTGYDLDLLWPAVEFKSRGPADRREEGWRIWPLYGSYREGGDAYRFAAWPLAQFWWNATGDESTQCVLPLWYRSKDRGHSLFLSLPYSSGSDSGGSSWWLVPPLAYHDSDKDSSHLITPIYWRGRDARSQTAWDALVPLFYSSRDKDGGTFATLLGGGSKRKSDSWWFALPALSGGRKEGDSSSTWVLAGLGHHSKEADREQWHAFPFCYSASDPGGRVFLSLPWSSGESGGTNAWSLVPPVWFHSRSDVAERTLTPLYSFGSESGGDHLKWSTFLPFYYRSSSDRGMAFVTLLGGYETDARDGSKWKLYPLLTGGRVRGEEGSVWVLGPVFHAAWDADSSMHHLLPLYYWNGDDRTFVSVAYSQWGGDGARMALVPPLLSFYSRSDGRSDLWTAAGVVHWSWGKGAGTRHILPVYMGDADGSWYATPLLASWDREGGGYGTAIPPMLSWWLSASNRTDLWVAGPLARFSWGTERGGSHLFPVCYWNTRTSTYASPLWASWNSGAERWHAIVPPALGYYRKDRVDRDLWLALGLFHAGSTERNGGSHSGHLMPLYLFDDGLFLTPLFGWNNGPGKDFAYFPTPLLGFWRNERSGMWLFPLFSVCRDVRNDSATGNLLWGTYRSWADGGRFDLFPLLSFSRWDPPGTNTVSKAGDSEGRSFDYLLFFGRHRSARTVQTRMERKGDGKGRQVTGEQRELTNRLFPLWNYAEHSWVGEGDGDGTSDFSLLLFLYDHRTERSGKPADGPPARYVRSRILYRLWHYERIEDAVSVDIFPAMTYDRRGEEMRKFSFLWRGLRYERSGDQRAVDLLFLPVWRTSWVNR
jgi:hypothetical protein